MDTIIPQRQCLDCKKFFPPTFDYFHKSPRGRDGLASYCKPCAHARANRNKRKPEQKLKVKEQKKRWYQANKEQSATYRKRWYQANREYALAKDRQFRIEHPEVLAARWQRWAKTEHGYEHCRTRVHNREARRKGASGNYTHADIQTKLKQQKSKCYYCDKKLEKYHIEHAIPIIRGGTNDISNIVLACPSCNLSKGTKMPHEFFEGGRLL